MALPHAIRFQFNEGEPALWIGKPPGDRQSGLLKESLSSLPAELSAYLCLNGFTFLYFDGQLQVFDAGGDVTPGLQVHLHSLCSGVEERQMFKIFRVEVSSELPVDVGQDIPVEIAGDPPPIVVG
jgi:hypothetical protein